MNIVVNGGSRGIGKEVALFLARDPENQIVVTGRSGAALDAVASVSPRIHAVVTDLTDQAELSGRFRDKVIAFFTSVDVLINMAGALVSREFLEIAESDARLMMETNFFGPAEVIRIIQPLMPKGSHILNISSMGGYQGSAKFRGLSYYSASKAAIACLSECLAEEFKEYGIGVNCLALGSVQTEMLETAFPGYRAPVEAGQIAPFIGYFALNGHKFMNGKILPLALSTP